MWPIGLESRARRFTSTSVRGDRQRNDRRGELERLVNNLHRTGRLRDRTTARALNLLLVLTSYETFTELREAGLSDRQLTATLQQAAHDLLLGGRGSR